jgi:suppressor for copper-sensitivity B
VLPVLSIKLLGVVSHGGGDVRKVRLSFLASAAGILCSFLILAGALATLKAMGAMVGWGMQFQQPWFLIAMTLVVSVFAGNLFGLFEIRLPRLIADAGERAGHVSGLGGHFLTGALATLLATPCSAPFLGTAVGFALAQGTLEILAVLLAVGIGLAAPYLAVAVFPRLATRLPRPGPWMTVLRRILGLALAVTAAWLVSVLMAQIGGAGALAIGALAAATVGATTLSARASSGATARVAAAAALVLVLASFVIPQRPGLDGNGNARGLWRAFDERSIPDLVAAGHVVLVNVTADWCITCKVNETLVLARDDVREKLASDGVVAMQGDWTRPDPAISNYLARFGRYGIPFDAVYGPGLPHGEALPELLTAEIVIAALERAAAAP